MEGIIQHRINMNNLNSCNIEKKGESLFYVNMYLKRSNMIIEFDTEDKAQKFIKLIDIAFQEKDIKLFQPYSEAFKINHQ